MATAELHEGFHGAFASQEAGSRAALAAPEWLFDVSAMTGSVGGLIGGLIGGGGEGPTLGAGFATLGVIVGGLFGAIFGRYVVMPAWAILTGNRSH